MTGQSPPSPDTTYLISPAGRACVVVSKTSAVRNLPVEPIRSRNI